MPEVALFTRAWIEIQPEMEALDAVPSPSSRGRGLKSISTNHHREQTVSPSSRGRGLKSEDYTMNQLVSGRPLHEGVD